MSLGRIFLEGFVGAVVSMMIGACWFSEFAFGRVWWKLTFAGFQPSFQLDKSTIQPPYLLSFGAIFTYSTLLAFELNVIYPIVKSSGYWVPMLLSLMTSGVLAAVSFNHHVYTRKPFPLFLINIGFDIVQTVASCFVIYFLLPA